MRAFLLLLLTLGGCAHGDQLTRVLSEPVDSAGRHQLIQQLGARRVKFNGPVTLQIGNGTTGTTTDARKARGPVAAAPGAVATQQPPPAATGPSWRALAWLAGLSLAAGVAGGFYLARRLPRWLPL